MIERKRAHQIQDAIRTVLFRDWDPIGVRGAAPEDEYDSYIGGVYRIITSSRSQEELMVYLAKVETEHMGLSSSPHHGKWRQNLRRVAQKLLALNARENLEDYLLAHSKKFQKSLKDSYREYKRKGGVSLETLIAQTGKEPARLSQSVRPSTSSTVSEPTESVALRQAQGERK